MWKTKFYEDFLYNYPQMYDIIFLVSFLKKFGGIIMQITLTQQKDIWKRVLAIVQEKLSNDMHVYQYFFEKTSLHSVENDTMMIAVNSAMCKTFLENKEQSGYKILKDAVEKVTETNFNLSFMTEEEIKSKVPVVVKQQENKSSAFFNQCILNPKYTFDNFVPGDCNNEAIQAALLVVSNPIISYNPLFIYSKPGLGKTHLLHALGNYYHEKNPLKRVQYMSADDFIDEFVKYVRGNQETENLKDYFKSIDLLLVDDIQSLKDKKSTGDMFFTIFNQMINSGKQIVLTSDRHPNDLQGLEERLVSRFNMGLSISMKTPDTDTLMKILEKKIISNQLDVKMFDLNGLLFLATNFSKNVRELEGALNRVIFYNITMKHLKRIDLNTIKESVSPMLKTKSNSSLSEEKIIDEVAEYYNMTDTQITSKVRTSQIALARRIAMYLCRELTSTPYKKIGALFGNRDHSTVITAVLKVETELKTDPQLANVVNTLKKRLKK